MDEVHSTSDCRFPRPSHMNASGFGGGHACFGAFGDEVAFVLCEDRELTKDHAPKGGASIDALSDDVEVYAACAEVFE